MFCRSSWLRICIFRTFNLSSYCGVLSSPFFFASSDIRIHWGRMVASCFFICGVTLGARWLARVSNSALVMTVLQSAEDLAAAVFACAGDGHTPLTVITAAVGGTAADGSPGDSVCGGAGVPGMACAQASVPNKTHISHLLRINHFLQDWSVRKSKVLSIKS